MRRIEELLRRSEDEAERLYRRLNSRRTAIRRYLQTLESLDSQLYCKFGIERSDGRSRRGRLARLGIAKSFPQNDTALKARAAV